jgi:hypothetical protein
MGAGRKRTLFIAEARRSKKQCVALPPRHSAEPVLLRFGQRRRVTSRRRKIGDVSQLLTGRTENFTKCWPVHTDGFHALVALFAPTSFVPMSFPIFGHPSSNKCACSLQMFKTVINNPFVGFYRIISTCCILKITEPLLM